MGPNADPKGRVRAELAFLAARLRTNIASQMEYRVAFVSQVLGMLVNDGIYFVFWILFFERFQVVGGWQAADMFLLFAVVTCGYGLALSVCGNATRLARTIAEGRLDYFLALPRGVLSHVLVSRSEISAIGDFLFGLIAYLFTGRFSLPELALFAFTSLLAAVVFVSFFTLAGSLAFWLGNAEQLALQLNNALMTLSLYPDRIFPAGVRFVLLALIPAAMVGSVPVRIISDLNWGLLLALFAFAAGLAALATWVFYRGLRRYESGSAIHVNL